MNISVQVGGYSEVAVMYRANSQGRSVEGALVSMGVPYRMLRARGFYERKEVCDP
jgi:DNA helicase-2/ATP-dependent DNA helicase PcrA